MAKTSYTTTQGDMWDTISLAMYGTEKQMTVLIDANPAYRETVVFPAGAVLTIPAITVSTIPSSVPPWKRGVS